MESCLAFLRLGEGGFSLAGKAKLVSPVERNLRAALERYAGAVNAKQEGSCHRLASGRVPHLDSLLMFP